MNVNKHVAFRQTGTDIFGFAGWLCEQYRIETDLGEWRKQEFIVESRENKSKYLNTTDGAWVFILDGRRYFGVPPDKVVKLFGLTRETYNILIVTCYKAGQVAAPEMSKPKIEFGAQLDIVKKVRRKKK